MIATKPSLEELQRSAKAYCSVPVAYEILSDFTTPIETLKVLMKLSDKCFLLESAERGEKWGRYSFLGYDPGVEVLVKDNMITVRSAVENAIETTDPNAELRKILNRYEGMPVKGLPPFTGGFVGYFAYEYYKYYEKITLSAPDENHMPDAALGLYNKVIAFDHLRQKMTFLFTVSTDVLEENYLRAVTEIESLIRLLKSAPREKAPGGGITAPFTAQFGVKAYQEVVEKAKAHIFEGDIFQVVPSNERSAPFSGSLLNAYRYLRTAEPSPYMFYLRLGFCEIMGASPETLIKKEGVKLSTFPIAGTRPRGTTDADDETNAADLLADEKEKAEHCMLVDLGRNDLGKLSRIGSVKVPSFLKLKKYSRVMHLTSTVTGEIQEGKDCFDALSAVLPAGTLSGAPKRRACQIIDGLEKSSRGVYGGSIGYIDFAGNMDMCIAIRMAVKKDGRVYVRSGGGVVLDSDPTAEYRETAFKAAAVTEALMSCGETDD